MLALGADAVYGAFDADYAGAAQPAMLKAASGAIPVYNRRF